MEFRRVLFRSVEDRYDDLLRAHDRNSFPLLTASRFLQVAAEAEAHRREQLVLEIRIAARSETLVERGGKNRHRYTDIDGCLDGPSSFARIGDVPLEFGERRILCEAASREVEQPRGDDTAAAPDFGDIGQIDIELVVLGMPKRCGFGVGRGGRVLSDTGAL